MVAAARSTGSNSALTCICISVQVGLSVGGSALLHCTLVAAVVTEVLWFDNDHNGLIGVTSSLLLIRTLGDNISYYLYLRDYYMS